MYSASQNIGILFTLILAISNAGQSSKYFLWRCLKYNWQQKTYLFSYLLQLWARPCTIEHSTRMYGLSPYCNTRACTQSNQTHSYRAFHDLFCIILRLKSNKAIAANKAPQMLTDTTKLENMNGTKWTQHPQDFVQSLLLCNFVLARYMLWPCVCSSITSQSCTKHPRRLNAGSRKQRHMII